MKTSDLHALYLDCNAVCTDTRTVTKNDMFFALKGDLFNGNTFAQQALEAGAKYAIIDDPNYAVADHTIIVEDVLKTLQALASYHRDYLNIPIIGLTGSNGKTTTKELINAVLSQKYNTTATAGNLNNHIGVPLTLLAMNTKTEIGIVEMGANHLKEIEFLCTIAKPNFGYITNFGKAHLEGFGSIEGVVKGKSELYNYIKSTDGTVFINQKDNKQVTLTSDLNTYAFGDNSTTAQTIVNLITVDPFVVAEHHDNIIKSQLIGSYNFTNISAAIAIGTYFKVNNTNIKTAIETYIPTNNRSQIIIQGTNKIILDAYNANPTSMRAALESFETLKDNQKVAILGDMFELGNEAIKEHQEIVDLAASLNIQKVYFIGAQFNEATTNSKQITAYNSFEAFKPALKELEVSNTTILIKASRGMKLERILDLI
ncbi:UDP-N-acetylmuramoyl-tripeptide--D-alanyl-D-alanine ligase [Formosa sediminum]|uniref:UDP-N-acetylmuramoyl-tripeptide--D-alanyl-D-alanine ligase n=1 Tax=Formosa sediminum TaxID=2594004 RepID=A0A516GMJ5_9FLAO|nr:UDP-N-acetylmuramoyl-tripeptide--D-alanyl-D-alanine ligase [Formosa sediminum]QDO92695.1 UDP-N-acetylmuramoyl-tripeptide--D-alanyl-D-alanine ligase [Formosa sediminum]